MRAALWFPSPPSPEGDEPARAALASVWLAHLSDQLEAEAHWEPVLSPGELQRLAIAQTILNGPAWLFLDEATSAFDEAQETAVYRTLAASLPATTLVSIGHRAPLHSFHERVISLARAAPHLNSKLSSIELDRIATKR
ncbi:MAG TPA: ATP-binding cassette domain-containing protein [Chthoniobacteraceae bacterium]|nr:ATP-binding cassette domain-containing protein [Chthoniobacteraceae bacterium]